MKSPCSASLCVRQYWDTEQGDWPGSYRCVQEFFFVGWVVNERVREACWCVRACVLACVRGVKRPSVSRDFASFFSSLQRVAILFLVLLAYVSSYYCICVILLLYMCPYDTMHITTYLSSYLLLELTAWRKERALLPKHVGRRCLYSASESQTQVIRAFDRKKLRAILIHKGKGLSPKVAGLFLFVKRERLDFSFL
jgi:hypothetical protein